MALKAGDFESRKAKIMKFNKQAIAAHENVTKQLCEVRPNQKAEVNEVQQPEMENEIPEEVEVEMVEPEANEPEVAEKVVALGKRSRSKRSTRRR
jgi:hypothetical protein